MYTLIEKTKRSVAERIVRAVAIQAVMAILRDKLPLLLENVG